jgi:hypothetical protein
MEQIMAEFVDSTSDERTVNNTMRQQYRVLSEEEKAAVAWFKETGETFDNYCRGCGPSREFEIARMKIEEAVMWAIKGVTA